MRVDTKRELILYSAIERGPEITGHNLDRACTWIDLGAQDHAAVEKLVEDLRITVNPKVGITLDGTVHILKIEQGSQELALRWNSTLPKGRGIEWLVKKLIELADNCKIHGKVKQESN